MRTYTHAHLHRFDMVDKRNLAPMPIHIWFGHFNSFILYLFEIWIENDCAYVCGCAGVWFYYRFSFSLFSLSFALKPYEPHFPFIHRNWRVPLYCLAMCVCSLVGCLLHENFWKWNKNKNRLLNNSWNFQHWKLFDFTRTKTEIFPSKMFWIPLPSSCALVLVPFAVSIALVYICVLAIYSTQIKSYQVKRYFVVLSLFSLHLCFTLRLHSSLISRFPSILFWFCSKCLPVFFLFYHFTGC